VHPDLCLRALHRVLEAGHEGRDREAGRGLLGDLQLELVENPLAPLVRDRARERLSQERTKRVCVKPLTMNRVCECVYKTTDDRRRSAHNAVRTNAGAGRRR